MLKYPRLVLTAGPRILWDYFWFINRYARHPEKYPLEKRYKKVRELIIYVAKHYRLDWKVTGFDAIADLQNKNQKFLLVADHLSYFDPLAIVALCEKPISFVAKKEAIKMPFIGTAIKAVDGVFLDREDLRQSLTAMHLVEKRLKEGYCSYMIFPEGTRNKHPENGVADFHPGTFKAAVETGVPMVACAIYGTPHVFPKKPDYKRLPLEFTFFKAEDLVGQNTTEIAPRIHDEIAKQYALDEEEEKNFFAKGLDKIPLRKGKVR
jgi:1-acyl-sn-glycerol-3-phosphate acyltransferase